MPIGSEEPFHILMDHTKKLPDTISFYLHLLHDYPGYIKRTYDIANYLTMYEWEVRTYRTNDFPPSGGGYDAINEKRILDTFSQVEYLFLVNETLVLTMMRCKETALYFFRDTGLIIAN